MDDAHKATALPSDSLCEAVNAATNVLMHAVGLESRQLKHAFIVMAMVDGPTYTFKVQGSVPTASAPETTQ